MPNLASAGIKNPKKRKGSDALDEKNHQKRKRMSVNADERAGARKTAIDWHSR
jgi:hypothetical protein